MSDRYEDPYYQIAVKRAKERDRYHCQICLSRGPLHVHHQNSYHFFLSQQLDINNLTTLCVNCHQLLHHIYGNLVTKITYEQFKNFCKLLTKLASTENNT